MNRALLVKQIRLKAGLTQQELGKLMSVDKTTVSRWEGGTINFEDSKMFELLHICEVNRFESFDLENEVILILRSRE